MENSQPKIKHQSTQEIVNTSSENLEVLSKENCRRYIKLFTNISKQKFETDNYIFDFQAYSKEDENMLLTGQFPLKIFIRLKNKNKVRYF